MFALSGRVGKGIWRDWFKRRMKEYFSTLLGQRACACWLPMNVPIDCIFPAAEYHFHWDVPQLPQAIQLLEYLVAASDGNDHVGCFRRRKNTRGAHSLPHPIQTMGWSPYLGTFQLNCCRRTNIFLKTTTPAILTHFSAFKALDWNWLHRH